MRVENMAGIDTYRTKAGQLSYRVRIRRNGSAPQVKTFTKLSDAKRWAQTQEGVVLAGLTVPTVDSKKPQPTLGKAFERYSEEILLYKRPSTQRSQRYQIKRLQRLLGATTLLVDISPARIRALCEQLKQAGASPATVVRYLALLSHLYSVAIREWEMLDNNPCRLITKPREPRGRERYLSQEEIQRLLVAAKKSRNKRLYLIVLLANSTGARLGELLSLCHRDIDLT